MTITKINLADLAFASHVYRGISDYDIAYRDFCTAVGNKFDISIKEQCFSLLIWLNKWGCRQFAKDQYPIAANGIISWFKEYSKLLPTEKSSIESLKDVDLNKLADAYEALRVLTASIRKNGVHVRIGPTGAAKILFALRPKLLPPWDEPIRKKLNFDGGKKSYIEYLKMIQRLVDDLHKQLKRVGLSEDLFTNMIDRLGTALPKLIDEYLWMIITRRFSPPVWVKNYVRRKCVCFIDIATEILTLIA